MGGAQQLHGTLQTFGREEQPVVLHGGLVHVHEVLRDGPANHFLGQLRREDLLPEELDVRELLQLQVVLLQDAADVEVIGVRLQNLHVPLNLPLPLRLLQRC